MCMADYMVDRNNFNTKILMQKLLVKKSANSRVRISSTLYTGYLQGRVHTHPYSKMHTYGSGSISDVLL